MSFSPKLVCLFLVVLLPATLYAQKKKDIPQSYGEIKVGDLTLDGIAERYNRMFRDSFGTPPVTITRMEAPEFSFSATEGVHFSKYLATEVSLVYYGTLKVDAISDDGALYKISGEFYGGHVVCAASWPLTKYFELYGKGGLNWSYSTNKLTSEFPSELKDKRDFNGANPVYGAGARCQLGTFYLSLDWTESKISGMDVTATNFGIGVRY